MIDITFKIFITCIVLSFILSPLGCYALWNRIAFSAETIAHSALLGISLSIFMKLPSILGVLFFAILIAFILWSQKDGKSIISKDAYLAVVMYSSLAIGYIFLSILPYKINPEQILWGDILLIQNYELYVMLGTALIITLIFIKFWKQILVSSIHEDLAYAERITTPLKNLFILLVFAVGLSISITQLGVLLSPAMLIIPATSAALLSSSPIQMIAITFAITFISNFCGIILSFETNWPTSPSIVLVSLIILFFNFLLRKYIHAKNKSSFSNR